LEKIKVNTGFKRFRKYLFRTIIGLLLLLLITSVALSLPYVQTKIAHYVTEDLNKTYGTNIYVDQVALTVFGGVKLKKVLIRDHHKDTLIYVNRVKTTVLGFDNLINSKLFFGDLRLDGLSLHIKNYKKEPYTNLDLFIDAFDDGKPTSGKFLMQSNNIFLTNSRFTMTDDNRKDPKDADFKKLNGHLKNFKIKGPNVTANIVEMSFMDYRGLFVKNLVSYFSYTKKNIKLEKLFFQTEESFLKGQVILSFNKDNKDFSNFNNKVLFDIKMDSANLATNDIRYFYKELSPNQNFLLNAKVKGTLNDFYATNLFLRDNKNSVIKGDVNFKNLFPRSPGKFYMKGDFVKISSNYNNLTKLLPNILGKKLPSSLMKLGNFNFTGKVEVTQQYINADFVMNTVLGIVESDLLISDLQNIDNAKYQGTIIFDNFDIGTFLNRKDFGKTSLNLDIYGQGFTQKYLNTTFVGDVNKVYYNGYTYSNINVDAYFKQPLFKGKLNVNDPNLFMDFDGLVDLSKKELTFDLQSKIDYANLEKLHFINDSIAIFKGDINIKAKGSTIDNMVGDVLLTAASYQNKKDVYFVDYLNINSVFDANRERTITINSPDALDGTVIGKFQFNQLQKMVENSLGSLYANYKSNKVIKGQYLKFNFEIYSKIIEVFYPDITLSANTNLHGNISSDSKDFKLNFNSPKIVAYENTFDNILLQVDNRNPLYSAYVQLDSIKTKHYKVRDFSMINSISNDTLHFRTEFKGGNKGQDFYNLNLYHTINKENENVVGFNKSELQFKNFLWYLNEKDEESNRIVFDKSLKNFNFEHIQFSHENQSILLEGILNGTASKDLKLTFSNVDLNKITPDVEKFKFDGNLDGQINLKQDNAIYQPTSSLKIKELKVNTIPLGDLNLEIKGDDDFKKFYLNSNLENKNLESFAANGTLEIEDNKTLLNIDLNFDKFNLGILGKIGGDVITNIRGFASGNASIEGDINELEYNGRLFVNNAGLTIPYLNVDYEFEDNSIVDVTENKFIVRETTIFDTKYKSKAQLNGFIKHKDFGDWQLDLKIEADRFLALDTKDEEDAVYFGTAFMKGTAEIKGPTSGLLIKVDAESAKGTEIKIPINEAESVSENDFIHFITPQEKENKLKNKPEILKNYNGLELDFNLDITENATIDIILDRESGHGMRGKGFGTLLLKINTFGKFNMWGDFSVNEGYYNFKYGNLIDKRFDVKKGGSIVWAGDPLGAVLNLEAIYKTTANPAILIDNPSFSKKVDVDVIIGVKGSLSNPDPDFNINFPTVSSVLKSEIQYKLDDKDVRQTQALALLSTNSFLSQDGISQSASSNIAFEKASSLFNNIFADEDGKLNLGLDYVSSDRTPGLETDGRVGVTVTSKINERISINGKVGVPVGGINESAIVGDVEVQYRVNEDGSLNLRMFNRENDINYIGQGIGYTQGLGISYEVDFNTFRELINIIFNKKKAIKTPKKSSEVHDSDPFEENGIIIEKKKDKKIEDLKPNNQATRVDE
jgi:hypothetical protein